MQNIRRGGSVSLEINKIHHMDALDFLRTFKDKSIDLIMTDPPYGIDIPSNKIGGSKNASATKFVQVDSWDKSIPSKDIFDEIFRVSKNQVIFGGNYFTKYLPPTGSWVVWDKRCGITPQRSYADCELVWTSFNKPARIIRFLWDGFIQDKRNICKEKRLHPTMKPLEVMKDLIKMFSIEGDIIMDPFSGSGSTLVACKQLNRYYIGSEINKEYVKICQSRLNQSTLLEVSD